MWSFVGTDRRLGVWKYDSPNTTEGMLVIKPEGSWVPAVDVPYLLEQKKHCPCNGNRLVQLVYVLRPTIDDYRRAPLHKPELRDRPVTFGIFKEA